MLWNFTKKKQSRISQLSSTRDSTLLTGLYLGRKVQRQKHKFLGRKFVRVIRKNFLGRKIPNARERNLPIEKGTEKVWKVKKIFWRTKSTLNSNLARKPQIWWNSQEENSFLQKRQNPIEHHLGTKFGTEKLGRKILSQNLFLQKRYNPLKHHLGAKFRTANWEGKSSH